MTKNEESSYLKYWDVNNLYGWEISPRLPVKRFKQVEDLSEFKKHFSKSYSKKSYAGSFLEVDIQSSSNLDKLHNNLPFLFEIKKVNKVKKLVANLGDRKGIYHTQAK